MAEKKILILSTEFGTERDELIQPLEKLKSLGHQVTLATPTGEKVQTMSGDKELADVVPADAKASDVSGEFDVIVLPGGTLNADAARMDADIQRLVTQQVEASRPVAAICHAPWVLVETGVIKGKKATSYESVRTDMKNAGANVVDEPVAICEANGWTLITSRTPDDLPQFIEAIDAL